MSHSSARSNFASTVSRVATRTLRLTQPSNDAFLTFDNGVRFCWQPDGNVAVYQSKENLNPKVSLSGLSRSGTHTLTGTIFKLVPAQYWQTGSRHVG